MGNQLATDQRAMGMAVKAIAAMENIELDAAETLMTILRAPIKEKKEDPMEISFILNSGSVPRPASPRFAPVNRPAPSVQRTESAVPSAPKSPQGPPSSVNKIAENIRPRPRIKIVHKNKPATKGRTKLPSCAPKSLKPALPKARVHKTKSPPHTPPPSPKRGAPKGNSLSGTPQSPKSLSPQAEAPGATKAQAGLSTPKSSKSPPCNIKPQNAKSASVLHKAKPAKITKRAQKKTSLSSLSEGEDEKKNPKPKWLPAVKAMLVMLFEENGCKTFRSKEMEDKLAVFLEAKGTDWRPKNQTVRKALCENRDLFIIASGTKKDTCFWGLRKAFSKENLVELQKEVNAWEEVISGCG